MAKNIFQETGVFNRTKKSLFDLGHTHGTTMNLGELVPISCIDVVPGDRFKGRLLSAARLSPLVYPIMDSLYLQTFTFYVRNRLIWPQFTDFISMQTVQNDPFGSPYYNPTAPDRVPMFSDFNRGDYTNFAQQEIRRIGGLWDHFGIPPCQGTENVVSSKDAFDVSLLPFAAYQRIWLDWFRNENAPWTAANPKPNLDIQGFVAHPEPEYEAEHQSLINSLLTLRHKNWEKDYFTAAFNSPQTDAAVTVDTTSGNFSIESLFNARMLQRWKYATQNHGSRYIEYLLGRWGVRSSDAVQGRTELVSASSVPVIISEVLQTTTEDPNSSEVNYKRGLGAYAGHGITVNASHNINYRCEEEGYLITLACVLPRPSYNQGIPRMFSRRFVEDYAQPEFAHLGDQAIKTKEIYVPFAGLGATSYPIAEKDDAWGYIPRYSDYKYVQSTRTSAFRTPPYDAWHLTRHFTTKPVLGQNFYVSNPTDRIFNLETRVLTVPDQVITEFNFQLSCRRALPRHTNPKY